MSKYGESNDSHGNVFENTNEDIKILDDIRKVCFDISRNAPITIVVMESEDSKIGEQNFYGIMIRWNQRHVFYKDKINDELYEFFETNRKELRMPEHSYSMNSVNKVIKKLDSYNLTKDKKDRWKKYFESESIKFDVVSLPESLSAVDQFFMDFNEGVQLVPYEIFKCRLIHQYDNLLDKDKSEVDRFKGKMDNEWLEFFYESKIKKLENESASEELWEFRLIEFICRMIYWEKYVNNSECENKDLKHPLDLIKFADKGTETGDMEILISSLKREDFRKIEKIMDELIKKVSVIIRNLFLTNIWTS